MKRPSPALAMLILFWTVYGLVAAVALYPALPPLQLELLILLCGIGSVLAMASVVLCRRASSPAASDERG
jgi:hypothetical protein